MKISQSGQAGLQIHGVRLPARTGAYNLVIRDEKVADIEKSTDRAAAQWLALPGLVNLHAHADRSFVNVTKRPASLRQAVEMSSSCRRNFTVEDVTRRATKFAKRSLNHGVTRLRTHTDVDPLVEMRSMEALGSVKDQMSAQLDVEIVAFSTSKNDLLSHQGRDRLEHAVGQGADIVGAGLNSSEQPVEALSKLFNLAEKFSLPVDLHMDEHLSTADSLTPKLIEMVLAHGLQGRVSLSHGCVLAAFDAVTSARCIDGLARAEITVIALPETNLFLQDRGAGTPKRRGITLAHELLSAGVKVRLGTDNVRDWFYPFGDGDMLTTALIASIAMHIDDPEILLDLICDGRRDFYVGDAADLTLVLADSVDECLARRPAGRITLKGGKIVSDPLTGSSPTDAEIYCDSPLK